MLYIKFFQLIHHPLQQQRRTSAHSRQPILFGAGDLTVGEDVLARFDRFAEESRAGRVEVEPSEHVLEALCSLRHNDASILARVTRLRERA